MAEQPNYNPKRPTDWFGGWLYDRLTSPEQIRLDMGETLTPSGVTTKTAPDPIVDNGNPITGKITEEDFSVWEDEVRAIPGITEDEINLAFRKMRADPLGAAEVPGVTRQVVTGRILQEGSDKLTADAATRKSEGMAGIELLQGQGDKLYGEQLGRIQGFLDNPSSIRSDAQLGKRLTDVESLLAGQLGQIRQGAAKTVSQAGLRAAGKVDTGVRAAEQNATAMQGKNISGLLGELGAEKTSLGTQQLGFNTGLTSARDTVNAGGISDLTNSINTLGSFSTPDYSRPTLTGYDLRGAGVGIDQFNAGFLYQVLSGIFGGVKNDVENLGQGVSSLFPGKRSGG